MAEQFSFDVVSKVNLQEVDNAVNQSMKEITQRFDFKGSVSKITRTELKLDLVSDDEMKIKSVLDILQNKLIKRGVSLKFLDAGTIEQALGSTAKQPITLKNGIPQEKSKEINKLIKDSGLKVQSQIQGEALRISSKSKDDLQKIIQFLKGKDLGIELQFENFR